MALPPIDCVRWRPDGLQLMSLGSDGVARWWDSSTFALLHTLRLDSMTTSYRRAADWTKDGAMIAFVMPSVSVAICDARDTYVVARKLKNPGSLGMLDVVWSPDGHDLATSIWGAGVGVWRAADFADLGFTERPSRALLEVRAIDWSLDGALFAAGGDGAEACIWDANTRRLLKSLPHNAPVDAIAFQPVGQLLASGTRSQRVELWNSGSGEHFTTLRGHTGAITSVEWTPDGVLLASSSEDGSIKLWEPKPQADRITFSKTEAIGPLAWQPGDRLLACGWADGTVKLLDTNSMSVKAVIEAPPDPRDLSQPSWSPDGRYLAWRHGQWAAVWDRDDLCKPAIRIERADMTAWHPTQSTAAFAVGDEVQLWDAPTRALLRTLTDEQVVYSLAWSRDGSFLATSGERGFITIWSARDWTRLQTFRAASAGRYVGVLAWDEDSRRLAVGCQQGFVSVWDVAAGVKVAAMTGHAAAVAKLAWTPDGKRIVSSSNDQSARIWDARTGDEVLLLTASDAQHVAISTDGMRIATAGKRGLGQIWDARAGYEQAAAWDE
jgi:WD40 repeat protein